MAWLFTSEAKRMLLATILSSCRSRSVWRACDSGWEAPLAPEEPPAAEEGPDSFAVSGCERREMLLLASMRPAMTFPAPPRWNGCGGGVVRPPSAAAAAFAVSTSARSASVASAAAASRRVRRDDRVSSSRGGSIDTNPSLPKRVSECKYRHSAARRFATTASEGWSSPSSAKPPSLTETKEASSVDTLRIAALKEERVRVRGASSSSALSSLSLSSPETFGAALSPSSARLMA